MGRRRTGLGDRKRRHDRYHRDAKAQGYRGRAVFKLDEIDKQHRLIERGARVLDLGCAPGSWLQYAAEQVGPHGHLVGIDRHAIDLDFPNLRAIAGDIYETPVSELLGALPAFDVVLSDMAPDTTGIRHVDQARSAALFEQALVIAEQVLAPAGHFVGKIFMGPDFQDLVKRCRANFDQVKIVKPAGSRRESIEVYVVARGLRPPTGE